MGELDFCSEARAFLDVRVDGRRRRLGQASTATGVILKRGRLLSSLTIGMNCDTHEVGACSFSIQPLAKSNVVVFIPEVVEEVVRVGLAPFRHQQDHAGVQFGKYKTTLLKWEGQGYPADGGQWWINAGSSCCPNCCSGLGTR